MSTKKIPDTTLTDRQREIYEAYINNGHNASATAKELSVTVTAVRKNLFYVARKGYSVTPDTFIEQAPAGFEMTFSTIQSNGAGDIVQRWDRVRPIEQNVDMLANYLNERIQAPPLKIKRPKKPDPNVLNEWVLADLHFGMLSWRKETGEDYDMKIAARLVADCAADVFARSGPVKRSRLVFLGDNFHTDFYTAQTEKSKNSLDVDSRFPKMVMVGTEVFISAIEYALAFSDDVEVIVLCGNHDRHSSIWLQVVLSAYFRNEPRVKINMEISVMRVAFWGCTAFGYQHGDNTKPARLCGDFLNKIAKTGRSGLEFFKVKQAHLHKELIDTINGVEFEIVPSPVSADAFAAGSNFVTKRATVATTFHKKYGELDRYTVTPYALSKRRDEIK